MRKLIFACLLIALCAVRAQAGMVIGSGAAPSCSTSNDSVLTEYTADNNSNSMAGLQVAQGFKVGANSTLTRMRWKLNGSPVPTGTCTSSVFADDGTGMPWVGHEISGTSVTIDASTIVGVQSIYFVLASTKSLTAATQYHQVLRCSLTGGAVYYYQNGAGSYTNGSESYSVDDGAHWNSIAGNDLNFGQLGCTP